MPDIKISPEVRVILENSTITGNLLILPPGQLNRKLYETVNAVLTHAGGKWNRGKKGHVFASDPRAKLAEYLETGTAVDERKQFQAFFTPPAVAALVLSYADVRGHRVLEPSAGEGALALACREEGAASVDCVELKPEHAARLRAEGFNVVEGDFLKQSPRTFDRVAMNPPFTRNQDIAHVEHALKFLGPGGVLVAVMSPNTSRPRFQELIAGRRHEIEKVPAGAFKESGTSIATVVVRIEAPDNVVAVDFAPKLKRAA